VADRSYLIEAQKNTLTAVRNLNDYNTSRNEAAINANAKAKGGWSDILWLFFIFLHTSFSSHVDNADPIYHRTAEEDIADDAGD